MWSLSRRMKALQHYIKVGTCCKREEDSMAKYVRTSSQRRIAMTTLGYCIVFNYLFLAYGRYVADGDAKSMNNICRMEGICFI